MKKELLVTYLVLASPFVMLTLFLLYPVISVLLQGLLVGPGSSYSEVLTSQVTHNSLIFTAFQAVLSMLLTVALGLPGSFLLARLNFTGKAILRAILLVPFVLPPIVVVVGFIQMLGPYGIVDTLLMNLVTSEESIIDLSTGLVGIVLAHAFYNIPLVLLMVSSSLERLDPDLEESAELLGATPFQKFRHVILPHILPSILAASVLIYLFCFMSFPIVLALGESRLKTLEVKIWESFKFFDYGEASTLAIIQGLVTIALAYSYTKLSRSDTSEAGRTAYIKTTKFCDLHFTTKISIVIYACILSVLVAGPFIAVIRAAFYDPFSEELTVRGFSNLLTPGEDGGLNAFINSISYATLSTILAVALGIPLAYAHRTRKKPVESISSMMTLLPLGLSSITVAYGLMRAIAVPLGLTTNPWPIIVIAQTIIGLPFSARAIEISLRNIDPDILEQTDSLGASRIQKFFFVELPLLAPGILAGSVFAFAMSIGEMSATILIALPQNATLPVAIYHNLGVRRFVEAGAAAFILVLVCLAAFLIIERVSEITAGGAV